MPDIRLVWPCVIVSVAALAMTAARGQQDLDAGKTGPQLFAQDCSTCHRSPQGLAKRMSGGSLVSFLRQHYTSSSTSANTVAAYVTAAGSNPRADRQKGDQAKQAPQDRSKLTRPGEPAPGQPASQAPAKQRDRLARPSDASVDQPGRPSRKSRRPMAVEPAPVMPPAAEPAAAEPPVAAVQSAVPAGPDETPAAPPSGGPQAGSRETATAVRPGFTEPLP